jgi:hypothetical protein
VPILPGHRLSLSSNIRDFFSPSAPFDLLTGNDNITDLSGLDGNRVNHRTVSLHPLRRPPFYPVPY